MFCCINVVRYRHCERTTTVRIFRRLRISVCSNPRRDVDRRGKTKISVIFTNCHGRKAMLKFKESSFLSKRGFCFLSETMVKEEKHSSCFPNKQNFVVHATKQPRPGGLEWYANPKFEAKQLFASQIVLVIGVQDHDAFVGVYYKPSTTLDDLSTDLEAALSHVPPGSVTVLGGDFNLRPSSTEFREVNALLNRHGLSLHSPTDQTTYHHLNSSSTLDYIFVTTGSHTEEPI